MKLVLGSRTGRGVVMTSRSRRTPERRGGYRLAMGLLVVFGVVSLAVSAPALAKPVTVTFTANTIATFRVPNQVTSLQIVATGGNGGAGFSGEATGGAGGSGSQISGTLFVRPGQELTVAPGSGGGSGTAPGAGCVNADPTAYSQGGARGTTEFEGGGSGEVFSYIGGIGGNGDLCGSGGGGGGGAGSTVVLPDGSRLIAGGGGGGGGSGGIYYYTNGGWGGDGGSDNVGGSSGFGLGAGKGGARGGAPDDTGMSAGDACAGCSAGGGGAGGGGVRGGAAGGAGGVGAGGGGGGGAGTDQIPTTLRNVDETTAPAGSGAGGVVTITYTPPSQTQTAVSCTPQSVLLGQASTCTVTVTDTDTSPRTPSGTVTFDTTDQGNFSSSTCILGGSGASARCSVSYTPEAIGTGTHTLAAAYRGDDSHLPSRGSQPVSVSLRSASMQTSCSPVRVALGQPSTCTATVTDTSTAGTAVTPSGTVTFTLRPLSSNQKGTFSDGGTCTPQGTGSTAVCSVSYTPTAVSGLHEIIAAYNGDQAHRGGLQDVAIVLANAPVGAPPPSPSPPPHRHHHHHHRHHKRH
jgi:hypothetical protein